MKIWGPAPSRRSQRGAGDVGGGSTGSPLESVDCLQCANPFDESVSQFFGGGRCRPACVECSDSSRSASSQPNNDGVSDGARRLVAKFRREAPVDLVLESPPLRTASDVRAVILGAFGDNDVVRTLTFGPWGHTSIGCCGVLEDAGDAVVAARALLSTSSTWSHGSLKSFSLLDVRLDSAPEIIQVIKAIPQNVATVRLVGLGLGLGGGMSTALQPCLDVLCKRTSKLHLDISGNGLTDSDLSPIWPPLVPVLSGLSLSLNPKITSVGVRELLETCGSTEARLESLDLSECSIGDDGASALAENLALPVLSKLQQLSIYRAGIHRGGLRLLLRAAAHAPSLRSLNVLANGQHESDWFGTVGVAVAEALRQTKALRVLTISCPEVEIKAVRASFDSEGFECRIILVPNEQNNYNRSMFSGHVH
eukprot:TRINITY_DN69123_c0_g1_i1.p1 TRINITY_DN69123_c0_g1~~TRINITY_DN69123_c0_g1_i1.p1  ORF type:complete len:452 (+),score=61.79 TRINITY_DN69123_c0_g1_i1:91-1356(+)